MVYNVNLQYNEIYFCYCNNSMGAFVDKVRLNAQKIWPKEKLEHMSVQIGQRCRSQPVEKLLINLSATIASDSMRQI